MSTAKDKVFNIALDSTALQESRSRKLQFTELAEDTKKSAFLNFVDTVNGIDGKYKIPIGKITPDKKGTNAKDVNVLVPVIPMLYSTTDLDKNKGLTIRQGWLYIYVNGFLWRELEVLEKGYMRDVNLTFYQNWYDRKANCEKDTRIVLPHKVDGVEQTVEVCFSEVQWGWNYINKMGGMDPKDPRLNKLNPNNKTKMPNGGDPAGNRVKRMTKVTNLGDYINGFESSPTSAEIISIAKTKKSMPRELHAPSKLGAIFLHDPIGVAKLLKEEHTRFSIEFEETSGKMSIGEYALAVMTNELKDAEISTLQKDPASKKIVEDKLQNAPLRRALENGSFYAHWDDASPEQQKAWATEYSKLSDKEFAELSNISQVLDTDKIDQAVKYWEDRKTLVQKHQIAAGKETVAMMDDDTQAITFDNAMLDYFIGNSPARVATGTARMCFFLEFFDFKEGAEYIKKLTDEKNLIGKQLCSASIVQKNQDIFRALESGDLHNFKPKHDEYKLDTDTIRGLTLNATAVTSKLLEHFAKVKASQGKPGLEWIAKQVKNYLGSSINIKVNEDLISVLYNPPKHLSKNVYHYVRPTKSVIAGQKAFYLSLDDRTPTETFKLLKDNAGFKFTFRSLVGVLEIINLYCAWNKVISVKTATNKDKAALGGAIVDIMKFASEMLEILFEEKASLFEKSSKSAYDKADIHQQKTKNRRARNKNNKKKYTKYQMDKKLAAKFSKAGYAAAAYASKYGRWTTMASSATRVLGVLGTAFMLVEGAFEMAEQTNMKGRIGVLIKTGGKSLMAYQSFNTIRFAFFAARGAAAGTVLITAGLMTSEFGIGIIILVVGIIVTIIGEMLMKDANRSKIIKDLDYCFFGQHPYGDWVLFDENEHERKDNSIAKKLNSRGTNIESYSYNIPAELDRIYRDLFIYDGYVEVIQLYKRTKVKSDRYHGYLIRGTLVPSQIVQNKSSFFVNIKLEYYDGTPGKLLTYNHLEVKEFSENSALSKIEFYHILNNDEIKGLKKVTMSTQLDIDGDGKRLVPKNQKKDFLLDSRIHSYYNTRDFFHKGSKIKSSVAIEAFPTMKIEKFDQLYLKKP